MATVTSQLQNVLSGRESSQISVIVEAEPGQGQQVKGALAGRGYDAKEVNVRNKAVFEATVNRNDIGQLATEESIAVIDHNPTFSPLAISPTNPETEVGRSDGYEAVTLGTAMQKLGVPEMWEKAGTRGEEVTIGMVDSPIDAQHDMLRDSVQDTEPGLSGETHGTWVASALVGNEMSAGDGTIHGACPDADLYSHGALSGGGASGGEVAEGVGYCIDNDVDVLNISFGGPHSEVIANVVQEAVEAGIAVVSSAGNSGPAQGSATCPGHHGSVATVGSIGTDGVPGAFSARGPGWKGTPKPDAVAYGGKTTLDPNGEQVADEAVIGAAPGGQTTELIGTSMACPEAAGVLALSIAADRTDQ